MGVIEAKFRPATPDEAAYAKGGMAWNVVNIPWNFSCKILGTFDLWRKSGNIINIQVPLPLQVARNIKWLCGYAPEHAFIRTYPTFRGTWNLIDSEMKVLEAFFAENRDSEIFNHGAAFFAMFEISKKVFPESKCSPEDFMFTCSAEKNQQYHHLIHKLISGNHIKENLEFIRRRVKDTLQEWSDRSQIEGKINITLETRIFASQIISQMVFGMTKRNEEVANAVNFINRYIVKQVLTKVSEEEKNTFGFALKTFNEAVNEVLNSDHIIPLFEESAENPLTVEQKKAMIFAIFFAGQETVGASLTYILRKVAMEQGMQSVIRSGIKEATTSFQDATKIKEVQALFTRCMKEFPPAHGVSRIVKVDTCLEFKLRGVETTYKHIFYAGERITGFMWSFAKGASPFETINAWKPFGHGPHRCPGENLARTEIMELITEALEHYTISAGSWNAEENPISGYVTLQFRDDVWLHFTRRMELSPKES